MSHSGRNVDSGNVDSGTGRGLLTSDTSLVTYVRPRDEHEEGRAEQREQSGESRLALGCGCGQPGAGLTIRHLD